MMMRCLDVSSLLTAEYDRTQDEDMKALHSDPLNYNPNPNGYYLSRLDINPQDVPGGLMKMSLRGDDWVRATPGDYRVVWMRRDETQRHNSWVKAFGYAEKDRFVDIYQRSEAYLLARTDCAFTYVNYEDVIADPVREFTRIKEDGWPINVEIASALVDPSLYRNRVV
jgi:hypothetical protein